MTPKPAAATGITARAAAEKADAEIIELKLSVISDVKAIVFPKSGFLDKQSFILSGREKNMRANFKWFHSQLKAILGAHHIEETQVSEF